MSIDCDASLGHPAPTLGVRNVRGKLFAEPLEARVLFSAAGAGGGTLANIDETDWGGVTLSTGEPGRAGSPFADWGADLGQSLGPVGELAERLPRAPLSGGTDSLHAALGIPRPGLVSDEVELHNHGVPYSGPWDMVGLADGTFVVVWLEPATGGLSIASRHFAVDGMPQNDIQRWATFGNLSPNEPLGLAAVELPSGGYAIAWTLPDGVHVQQVTSDDQPIGDVVHVADNTTSGEQIDIITTSNGHLFVTWLDYQWQTIYGHEFGVGLIPLGSVQTLVEAPADRLISRPTLTTVSANAFGLQWSEGPLGSNVIPPGGEEIPGRGGGSNTNDFAFYYQRHNTDGASPGDISLLSQSSIDVPPAIGISPDGAMAVLETSIVAGETQILLKLFSSGGNLDSTQVLATSRFLSHLVPRLTALTDGGFVATYGVPYADGPIFVSQQFNRSATPIGPSHQLNVGDDVGYPPSVRVGAQTDLSYVVAWPHQLVGVANTTFVARAIRLPSMPFELTIPTDQLLAFEGRNIVVRISGLPESTEFTAGKRSTATSWEMTLDELEDLLWIGEPPYSALTLGIDFIDAELNQIVLSQSVWLGTDHDDVLLPLDGSTYFDAGEGIDTFIVGATRASYRADRQSHGTVVLRRADTGETRWELVDFERIRFQDIVLPIEFLVHDSGTEYSATYDTNEDTLLDVTASIGVLPPSDSSPSAPHRGNVFMTRAPSDGTLQMRDDGSFTFTPTADWSGSTNWSYDSRPMAFRGPVSAEGDGDIFVATHGQAMPTFEFDSLPNQLVDGRQYTVSATIVSIDDSDSSFGFALLGGGTLVADELGSAIFTSSTTGRLTFHFTKSPAHSGLTLLSDGGLLNVAGSLRFTEVKIVDEYTGEIIANTAIRDDHERQVKIDVLPVADRPTLAGTIVAGQIGDPVSLSLTTMLVDGDGSESLNVWLSGLPIGTVITDGIRTAVIDAPSAPVDISNWDLDDIQLLLPDDGTTHFELEAAASATEGLNHHQAISQLALPIELSPRDPITPNLNLIPVLADELDQDYGMFDFLGGNGAVDDAIDILDTLFGGAVGDNLIELFSEMWQGGGNFFDPSGTLFDFIPFADPPAEMGDESGPDSDGPEATELGENEAGDSSVTGDEGGETAENEPQPAASEIASSSAEVTETSSAPHEGQVSSMTDSQAEIVAATPVLEEQLDTAGGGSSGIAPTRSLATGNGPAVAGTDLAAAAPRAYIVSGKNRVPAIFAADELWHEMDAISQDVSSSLPTASIVVGSAVVVASGFSAAQVLWLLRGSVLVTKLMSSMPMWISFDPLPILDAQTAQTGRSKNRAQTESLADIASSQE